MIYEGNRRSEKIVFLNLKSAPYGSPRALPGGALQWGGTPGPVHSRRVVTAKRSSESVAGRFNRQWAKTYSLRPAVFSSTCS